MKVYAYISLQDFKEFAHHCVYNLYKMQFLPVISSNASTEASTAYPCGFKLNPQRASSALEEVRLNLTALAL